MANSNLLLQSRPFAPTFAVLFKNMVSHINKSFVWLWMAVLLSASVGVSIQQVYCYCIGKTTVSLFTAEDSCQVANIADLADCCKKTAPSKKSCCEKPDAEKQGCTKKTTKVFQLKTEFEVGNAGFKKLDAPKSWGFVPALASIVEVAPLAQNGGFQAFERPPPPLSGRMICIRQGVFRC
jgi:hypothetical protein